MPDLETGKRLWQCEPEITQRALDSLLSARTSLSSARQELEQVVRCQLPSGEQLTAEDVEPTTSELRELEEDVNKLVQDLISAMGATPGAGETIPS